MQYLTYFGKFLEDLGITGELSLSEKDNNTHLQFIPENKEIALENITAILNSYLSLPEKNNISLITPSANLESEIRFQQLASTIQHLQSQLRLSEAMISIKNREIELLDRKSKYQEDVTKISSTIKDYWEPIEGFKIKPYKGKFFEIDIPKLIEKAQKSKK